MMELTHIDLDVRQSLMTYVQACLGGHVISDNGDRGQIVHDRLGGLNVELRQQPTLDPVDQRGMIGGIAGSLVLTADQDGSVATATAIRVAPATNTIQTIDLIHEFRPARFVAVPAIEHASTLWVDLAHTFDGYARCGGFEGCRELADGFGRDEAGHDLAASRAALLLSARADRFGDATGEISESEIQLTRRIATLSGGVLRADVFGRGDGAIDNSDQRTRWTESAAINLKHVHWPAGEAPRLYLVEHVGLGVRKVGKTTAGRLSEWRRRGWTLLDFIDFDTSHELDTAEQRALGLLDRMGARATPKMESLFSNLARDGRFEMFDPSNYAGTLTELLGNDVHARWAGQAPDVPLWISAPRKAAARKAHQHPNRDQKAAARKAVVTKARTLEVSSPHSPIESIETR